MFEAATRERLLDLAFDGFGIVGVGLYGQNQFVAMLPRQVDHGVREFRPADRAPVEVVDSPLEGFLNGARRRTERRTDPEPARLHSGPTDLSSFQELVHALLLLPTARTGLIAMAFDSRRIRQRG